MAGEVWGLDAHPFKALFATAGDDKSVRVWSATDHRLVQLRKLKSRARR
jgi:microtubule-associated protein-like 6